MKFTTHNDGPINVSGTSKFSSIQATTHQLVKAFGQPIIGEEGENPLMLWEILFEDGMTATVYLWNWHVIPDPTDVVTWNVGARKVTGSWEVHQSFREAHGLLAQRAA